jgi:hypothetical protein
MLTISRITSGITRVISPRVSEPDRVRVLEMSKRPSPAIIARGSSLLPAEFPGAFRAGEAQIVRENAKFCLRAEAVRADVVEQAAGVLRVHGYRSSRCICLQRLDLSRAGVDITAGLGYDSCGKGRCTPPTGASGMSIEQGSQTNRHGTPPSGPLPRRRARVPLPAGVSNRIVHFREDRHGE